MGEVYLAEHRVLRRRVAAKFLHSSLAAERQLVDRFFVEARATAAIHHPGIVDVHDFGHDEAGAPYIIMELLEGETLRLRLVSAERLPASLAAAIARQIAGAVSAAHDLGIVHRDLKPDNVFLVADRDLPGGVRVKVLDFGIAKLASAVLRVSPEERVTTAR